MKDYNFIEEKRKPLIHEDYRRVIWNILKEDICLIQVKRTTDEFIKARRDYVTITQQLLNQELPCWIAEDVMYIHNVFLSDLYDKYDYETTKALVKSYGVSLSEMLMNSSEGKVFFTKVREFLLKDASFEETVKYDEVVAIKSLFRKIEQGDKNAKKLALKYGVEKPLRESDIWDEYYQEELRDYKKDQAKFNLTK